MCRKNIIIVLFSVTVLLGLLVGCGPAPTATTTPTSTVAPTSTVTAAPAAVITWNMATMGILRASIAGFPEYAARMEKATNGRWVFKLNYNEALCPINEIPEGLMAGAFQVGQIVTMYYPGKFPLMNVGDLAFIGTGDYEVQFLLNDRVLKHPSAAAMFAKWGIQSFLQMPINSYQLIGKKLITKLEDFQGVRIRIAAAAGEILKPYGAVISMVSPPEMYSALDKGTIDEVSQYASGSVTYSLQEVSKYYQTGFDLNSGFSTWACRIADWNALPDDIKKIHEQVVANMSVTRWHTTMYLSEENKALDVIRKTGIQISTFPASERARLVVDASKTWDAWAKGMDSQGLAGSVILKYYIEQRDLAIAQLQQTTTTAK